MPGQRAQWRVGPQAQRVHRRVRVKPLKELLYNALYINTSQAFAYVTRLATQFKIYMCFSRRALPRAVTDQIEDFATSKPRLQIFGGIPQTFADGWW